MKRAVLVLLATAVMVLACACSGAPESPAGATPTVSERPTPQPTPQPVGAKKVFGKDVAILALCDGTEADAADFFAGAGEEAKALGFTIEARANADIGKELASADGFDAAIVYKTKKDGDYDAYGAGPPVLILDAAAPASVPSHVYVTDYSARSAVDDVLREALVYPPHDTPVRLIGVFTGEKSELAEAFHSLFEQGKVLPKMLYYADAKGADIAVWTDKMLETYYEGMVDGIVCETPELALAVLNKLEAAGREDMEIFALGCSARLRERMVNGIMAVAVGLDENAAGRALVMKAADAIKSGSAQRDEIVAQAMFAAGQDEPEWLARYEKEYMAELRAFYKSG